MGFFKRLKKKKEEQPTVKQVPPAEPARGGAEEKPKEVETPPPKRVPRPVHLSRSSQLMVPFARLEAKDQVIVDLLHRVRFSDPEDKCIAARELAGSAGTRVRRFLVNRLAVEEDPTVRAVLQEELDKLEAEEQTIPRTSMAEEFGLAPAGPEANLSPLSERAKAAFQRFVDDYNRTIQGFENLDLIVRSNDNLCIVDEATVEEALQYLEDITYVSGDMHGQNRAQEYRLPMYIHLNLTVFESGPHVAVDPSGDVFSIYDLYGPLIEEADFNIVHFLHLQTMLGLLRHPGKLRVLERFRAHPNRQLSLREMANALEVTGYYVTGIAHTLIQKEGYDWGADQVREYWIDRVDALEDLLSKKKAPYSNRWTWPDKETRLGVWDVLDGLPRVPPSLKPVLLEYALGKNEHDRQRSQRILQRLDGIEDDLKELLKSKKKDERMRATEWLDRIMREGAAAPRKELTGETGTDEAKGPPGAIESLGVALGKLVDRESLGKEAEKGLKKGVPKDMEWFPYDQMPTVRWADDGTPVDPQVLTWLIVRAFKGKEPVPDPMLRQATSLFTKLDREALGKFVLDRWIAYDLRTPSTRDEAAEVAREKDYDVRAFHHEVTEGMIDRYMRMPVGTASKQKGILAVCGACCSSEVVPTITSYLRTWHSYRWNQGVYLLKVLAHIEEPLAVQALLQTASRHRTAKIRAEAYEEVQALAERNHWTMDQLEDRTVPTGGFDENRELELDYGPRRFTAQVTPDLKVVIRTEEGKVLKSTPQPGDNDDPDKASEAKKAISAGKKEITQVVKRQAERLYEAMCTQREWPFEEWDAYLNRHPILSYMCQGLVWAAYRDGELVTTFRPLEDMSLTDVGDNEVRLTAEHTVRLAHALSVPEDVAKAWSKHLRDYKLKPTIQQFDRKVYRLPADLEGTDRIDEFNHHWINCKVLGGKLSKHGFARGVDDIGYFYTYEKKLKGLGVEVAIQFSGVEVYNIDQDVKLRDLHFTKYYEKEKYYREKENIPLSEVPPILLSEYYNLMAEMAKGTRYDPEFQGNDEHMYR